MDKSFLKWIDTKLAIVVRTVHAPGFPDVNNNDATPYRYSGDMRCSHSCPGTGSLCTGRAPV